MLRLLLVAISASALMAQTLPAAAQDACLSGKTLFGGCMPQEVADRARTRSVLMVQRRISVSAQVNLPKYDTTFLSAGTRAYIR
jgi:hypothetical protein